MEVEKLSTLLPKIERCLASFESLFSEVYPSKDMKQFQLKVLVTKDESQSFDFRVHMGVPELKPVCESMKKLVGSAVTYRNLSKLYDSIKKQEEGLTKKVEAQIQAKAEAEAELAAVKAQAEAEAEAKLAAVKAEAEAELAAVEKQTQAREQAEAKLAAVKAQKEADKQKKRVRIKIKMKALKANQGRKNNINTLVEELNNVFTSRITTFKVIFLKENGTEVGSMDFDPKAQDMLIWKEQLRKCTSNDIASMVRLLKCQRLDDGKFIFGAKEELELGIKFKKLVEESQKTFLVHLSNKKVIYVNSQTDLDDIVDKILLSSENKDLISSMVNNPKVVEELLKSNSSSVCDVDKKTFAKACERYEQEQSTSAVEAPEYKIKNGNVSSSLSGSQGSLDEGHTHWDAFRELDLISICI